MTEKPKLYSTKVPKPLDKARIDIVLVNLFQDISRGKIRKFIDDGNVFLNKKRIWIAKYEVATGDLIEINLEQGDKSKYEFNQKNVLYDDENFLVLNKPAGVLVEDSKKNFPIFKILKKLNQNYEQQEFFAVNRLDKETSGLMLVAKRLDVQADLLSLWANKKIEKIYQALVLNVPKKLIGNINTNIGQNSGHVAFGPKKESKFEGGKTALTSYKVLAVLNKGAASIMSIEPKTGRSHQIRIHLASIGCPILGDKIYGSKYKANSFFLTANRQMLHASQLIFELYGVKYNFHAPAPTDFNQTTKFLKSAKTDTKIPVSKRKIAQPKKDKLRPTKRRKQGETAMRDKIFSNKIKRG